MALFFISQQVTRQRARTSIHTLWAAS